MIFRASYLIVALAGAVPLGFACSATSDRTGFTGRVGGTTAAGGSSSAASSTASSGTTTTGAGGSGGALFGTGGLVMVTASCAAGGPNDDMDHDGWTPAQGDCNDCDPNVNPGAIDTPAYTGPDGGTVPASDNDCDGKINVDVTCDANLALADTDPVHGANAIELCQTATAQDRKWGVLSATYTRADGTPYTPSTEVGLLQAFGPNVSVRAGTSMLVLSSGHARLPGQPGACGSLSCKTTGAGTAPAGFPQNVPNCTPDPHIVDDTALELQIRAPTNATGYSFNFKFHSFEYPSWVCTTYNDQFITLVSPAPMGALNGNISFDSNHNPVSVNLGYFEVCDPTSITNFGRGCHPNTNPGCPARPNPYCPSGLAELQGTGFDIWGGGTVTNGGATAWLQTSAPVQGGSTFTIRFAIWDTGNYEFDSTVLVDNFQWVATGGTVSTETVPVTK
jgi:hypothetical protein